ncbi:hypothetical protein EV121DRAFT_212252 [Schizophyllum commune]
MHLIFENVIKNLIKLWTGDYKDIPEGTGDYQFERTAWDAIGAATGASGDTIPGVFGARPPDIAQDNTSSTADTWSFWILHIGPALLSSRFKRPIYYSHFISFVRLVNSCMKFKISRQELDLVRQGFRDWVVTFEKLYYQHDPLRIATCPVTIHALLHIADSIEQMGPVWTYWAFTMERFCGRVQRAIHSRRFPWANIDVHLTAMAQINQLKLLYGPKIAQELSLTAPPKARVEGEFRHPSYPTCALLPPMRRAPIDSSQLDKICVHLQTRYNADAADVRQRINIDSIRQYGRVRVLNGGDDMRASELVPLATDRRDATWVKYDLLVDRNKHRRRAPEILVPKSFFGQLMNIYVVEVLASPQLHLTEPETVILARIHSCTPCNTNSLGQLYYKDMGRYEVVDIHTVQCLVGRVPRRWPNPDLYAILDRSSDLNHSLYIPDTS